MNIIWLLPIISIVIVILLRFQYLVDSRIAIVVGLLSLVLSRAVVVLNVQDLSDYLAITALASFICGSALFISDRTWLKEWDRQSRERYPSFFGKFGDRTERLKRKIFGPS